jgi:hypothetical protein
MRAWLAILAERHPTVNWVAGTDDPHRHLQTLASGEVHQSEPGDLAASEAAARSLLADENPDQEHHLRNSRPRCDRSGGHERGGRK